MGSTPTRPTVFYLVEHLKVLLERSNSKIFWAFKPPHVPLTPAAYGATPGATWRDAVAGVRWSAMPELPPLDPALFESKALRAALADRDVTAVYRLLVAAGVSQRHIASVTGQSQSEVSAIVHGRVVMGYDVLVRICTGLGVPRSAMGLAYNYDQNQNTNANRGDVGDDEDEMRRRLLLRGFAALCGAKVVEQGSWVNFVTAATSRWDRVGKTDVIELESMIAAFRTLDREFGGLGLVESISRLTKRADHLLAASSTEFVRKKMAVALADLFCLAGWVTNDVNLADTARACMVKALDYANISEDPAVISIVLRTVGRIEAHRGDPNHALKFLQLAEIDAKDELLSIVKADEAKLCAQMGLPDHANAALAQCDRGHADICSVVGETYLLLDDYDSAAAYLGAIERTNVTARSAAIESCLLATTYVKSDDSLGLQLARNAITDVNNLSGSLRTKDRLIPLAAALRTNGSVSARQLLASIPREYVSAS